MKLNSLPPSYDGSNTTSYSNYHARMRQLGRRGRQKTATGRGKRPLIESVLSREARQPTIPEKTPWCLICSILVYLLLLLAASPWLVWSAIRKGKYREGYAEKLLGLVPRRSSQRSASGCTP